MHWLVTENLNVEEDKGHWSIIAKLRGCNQYWCPRNVYAHLTYCRK